MSPCCHAAQLPTTNTLTPDPVSASVTFATPAAASTVVTFTRAGVYRLRLLATSADLVVVTGLVTVWVPEVTTAPTTTSLTRVCFQGGLCEITYAWRWLPLFVAASTSLAPGGGGDSSSSRPDPDLSLMNGTHTLALIRPGDAPLDWYTDTTSNASVGGARMCVHHGPLCCRVAR